MKIDSGCAPNIITHSESVEVQILIPLSERNWERFLEVYQYPERDASHFSSSFNFNDRFFDEAENISREAIDRNW